MEIVIVGGGAAGVAAAIKLKKLNKDISVTILEKNDRILKKLLKTGNGKCNISNYNIGGEYYNNSKFINEVIKDVTPSDVRLFFKEIGLLIRNDSVGRIYPYSESATTVVDLIRNELDILGVNVITNCDVISIKKSKDFLITTNNKKYKADYVIVSSGSKAQEQTNGYNLLENMGHSITTLRPGLVALKVKEDIKSLQGIRIKCLAKVVRDNQIIHEEIGELLFKEEGLSGILIFSLSRYTIVGATILLDLFFDYDQIYNDIEIIIKTKNVFDMLTSVLPKMLGNYIFKNYGDNITDVYDKMRNLPFTVVGDYGFNQGQIVCGGINVNEVNLDFSSKLISGLYICGEVLDIDGASGGYNLHFAWTSGIVAAKAIVLKN